MKKRIINKIIHKHNLEIQIRNKNIGLKSNRISKRNQTTKNASIIISAVELNWFLSFDVITFTWCGLCDVAIG